MASLALAPRPPAAATVLLRTSWGSHSYECTRVCWRRQRRGTHHGQAVRGGYSGGVTSASSVLRRQQQRQRILSLVGVRIGGRGGATVAHTASTTAAAAAAATAGEASQSSEDGSQASSTLPGSIDHVIGDELVLVVGGTGRVGRRIVARLAAAGVRVRVHPTLYARIRNPKPRPKL